VLHLQEAGTILYGRYRVTELVARGGMGAVYRAEDLRLPGRECALKEILLYGEADEDADEAREQFYREASVLARLDHPNLPKVSDYFSEGGRDYLVMDFVPGPSLQELVDEANAAGVHLPEEQVLQWARQLCNALEYLHGQEPPILHRDIKPANIRLTAAGVVKLVDFGLVKLLRPEETRTITVVHGRGTAPYTPFEQYGGDSQHTDQRSDIYALGATLYHLLTGQPPPSARERFLRPGCLAPPQELNPRLSSRVDRAVLWAMAMHPEARPRNVAEFRAALLGEKPLPEAHFRALDPVEAMVAGSPWQESWFAALQANLPLIGLVLALLALAVHLSA
jgi:serine/threonine protein kinase